METNLAPEGAHRTMKGRRFTPRDKILIVMEFIETDIKMADLCRKHNLNPGTFSRWKTRFMDGGRKHIESRGVSDRVRHQREIDKLKQTIAEQTIVIEELKKPWRAKEDDPVQTGTEDAVKKGAVVHGRVKQHAVLQGVRQEGRHTA